MSDVLADAPPEASAPAAPTARPAVVIPFPVDRRRAAEAEARRRHPSARTV